MKIGFDNQKYVKIQSEHIKERIAQFGNKLYLELGGKLFDDHHASRVLPGFKPDSKLSMFQQLADSIEIVIVISAKDIEKNKVRQDLGITYDKDVLRLRSEFMNRGFLVSSVVITHYNGQASADAYRKQLEYLGIKAYYHYTISHCELVDGVHVAKPESLICLKCRAYVDLATRRAEGESIDSRKVNKHKRDVFRLVAMLAATQSFAVPHDLYQDILVFAEMVRSDMPNADMLNAIGIYNTTAEDVLQRLLNAYVKE